MAKYKGKRGAKGQYQPKAYNPLSQELLKDMTVNQLQRLIKKEVRTANSRMRRLRQSGDIDSPVINDKWRNFYNNPYGTQSGMFSTTTKGRTKEELEQQLLTIRQFLSAPTTKTQIAEYKKTYGERTGISIESVDEVMDIVRQLYKLGYTYTEVNSDILKLIETELQLDTPIEDIIDIVSGELQGERGRQEAERINFAKRNQPRRWKSQ